DQTIPLALTDPRGGESLDQARPAGQIGAVEEHEPTVPVVAAVGDRHRRAAGRDQRRANAGYDRARWRRLDRYGPVRVLDRAPLVSQRDPEVVLAVRGDRPVILPPVPRKRLAHLAGHVPP